MRNFIIITSILYNTCAHAYETPVDIMTHEHESQMTTLNDYGARGDQEAMMMDTEANAEAALSANQRLQSIEGKMNDQPVHHHRTTGY